MNKNDIPKKGFNLKGLANSIKNQFDREDELYDEAIEEDYIQNISTTTQNEKTTIRRNKPSDKTLCIFKPRNKEDDVAEIITNLRDGSPCIVNVSEVSEEEAKRIIDNISGAAFALMGSGIPISKGIYTFVPKSFDVADKNIEKTVQSKDYIMMQNN